MKQEFKNYLKQIQGLFCPETDILDGLKVYERDVAAAALCLNRDINELTLDESLPITTARALGIGMGGLVNDLLGEFPDGKYTITGLAEHTIPEEKFSDLMVRVKDYIENQDYKDLASALHIEGIDEVVLHPNIEEYSMKSLAAKLLVQNCLQNEDELHENYVSRMLVEELFDCFVREFDIDKAETQQVSDDTAYDQLRGRFAYQALTQDLEKQEIIDELGKVLAGDFTRLYDAVNGLTPGQLNQLEDLKQRKKMMRSKPSKPIDKRKKRDVLKIYESGQPHIAVDLKVMPVKANKDILCANIRTKLHHGYAFTDNEARLNAETLFNSQLSNGPLEYLFLDFGSNEGQDRLAYLVKKDDNYFLFQIGSGVAELGQGDTMQLGRYDVSLDNGRLRKFRVKFDLEGFVGKMHPASLESTKIYSKKAGLSRLVGL
ncbi:MAG: hypothetical protein MAG795_00149 [Candidatus Woesearchaeota archaeon]|nr:hypothetical protein [Candidatus Woesearchaeota archaeon]